MLMGAHCFFSSVFLLRTRIVLATSRVRRCSSVNIVRALDRPCSKFELRSRDLPHSAGGERERKEERRRRRRRIESRRDKSVGGSRARNLVLNEGFVVASASSCTNAYIMLLRDTFSFVGILPPLA